MIAAGGAAPATWPAMRVATPGAQFRRRVDQHGIDDRRAAHMRHAVRRGSHPSAAFASTRRRQTLTPARSATVHGKAPAVAMEHRQRPEIHRVLRHAPVEDVADRVQMRAAMVIDHALRIAGGARRVVQRDRIPLVGRRSARRSRDRPRPGTLRRSISPSSCAVLAARIVDVDDQRLRRRATPAPCRPPARTRDR